MANLDLPKELKLNFTKHADLRYGENPHQKSALYIAKGKTPDYKQLWGIELSHNNLDDANSAWSLVCEFKEPTVAIIKHGNPSGVASRENLKEAFQLAYDADDVSAFGGIIALNCPPTLEMIEEMRGKFFELIVAPQYSADVIERLKQRSKKMRVIEAKKPPELLEFTKVFGGYLVQTPDEIVESKSKWEVQSGGDLSEEQYSDMEFAWKVVKHIKSNAIVLVKNKEMVGMGAGQPNRVNSVALALKQAKSRADGSVMASDAFFPFADNVITAAAAGISVIVQPGGSINDAAVVAEAKKQGVIMVFTGVRHFKH